MIEGIENLRYSVRAVRDHRVVAVFAEAGAAHRMMCHENDWAERMGARGPAAKYEVFDNKDNCTMTWGAHR